MPKENGQNLTAKKRAFLAAFLEAGTVTGASRAAAVSRDSHYRWLHEDSIYSAAFDCAKTDAIELLESEARRRAVQGVKKLKFYKGEPIIDPETGEPYFEHEYSDVLLIFLLKGAMPRKYREGADIKHTSNEPGRVAGLSRLEVIKQRIRELETVKAGIEGNGNLH